MKFKLNDLLERSGITPLMTTDRNPTVTVVTEDSRRVEPGALFVATHGAKIDSHLFVSDAVEKGASGIVVQDSVPAYNDIAIIQSADSRDALGRLSHAIHGNPTEKMQIIGVTGTNGKTTTTYILESILSAAKLNPGIIGTIEYRYNGESHESVNTTPSSSFLAKIFSRMKAGKVKSVAMEVSSHAADQRRISGIQFDACIFTNLTQDHLDYHHTMEEYADAKWKIFDDYLQRYSKKSGQPPIAVFNTDDSCGANFSRKYSGSQTTYGIESEADIKATNIRFEQNGTEFNIVYKGTTYNVKTSLVGLFNIYNVLGGIAATLSIGIPMETVLSGIERLHLVPGRFEAIREGQDFLVLVDYAHTPDALERVLTTARKMTDKNVIVVFGCGGDRDSTKRPIMGEIAGRLAEKVIITNDNPRTEDPVPISEQIVEGIVRANLSKDNYSVVLDRRAAIHQALSMAQSKDVVIIAGKGHEDYQILGEHKIHFDDREIARNFLRERQQQG